MNAVLKISLSIALLFTVTLPLPLMAQNRSRDDADHYELMKLFAETFEEIERNYVKDVDRKELMQAAIEGMLHKLDPHSNYISPDEMQAFNEAIKQEFGGIGIRVDIDRRTGRLLVISPLPGTPAYNAGVKAGDLIVEIEGKSTDGFSIRDAQKLLKGKPGEKVTIGVIHAGDEDVTQIPIERARIQVNTVMGDHYDANGQPEYLIDSKRKIGYVRLTHFSDHSAVELETALAKLKEQGMRGLVLDLRDNPGGLLSQAIEIADMFIDEGKIVSTKGRNSPERSWSAQKLTTVTHVPMTVLINHSSASASEILSACLQDHKRAKIVGERSYGKGSVQNVITLAGTHSALKLTMASYHRPSGENIHRFPGAKDSDVWGVMPDDGFAYRMNRDERRAYDLNRRARDVISASGPPKTDYKDPQLALALEYLDKQLDKPSNGAESPDKEKPKSESESKAEAEPSQK